MFGICLFSSIFGLPVFTLGLINSNGYSVLIGLSWFGSVFGVLSAIFILKGANADDPDFFMQNHTIMVK